MTAPEVTEAFQTLRDLCPAYARPLVDALECRLIAAEYKVAQNERFRRLEALLSAPPNASGQPASPAAPGAGAEIHMFPGHSVRV